VIVSLKAGRERLSAPQSGPSSRSPDRLKLAVLGGSKTQRGGQNAILVNIAHILQLQPPLTSASKIPEVTTVFAFFRSGLFLHGWQKNVALGCVKVAGNSIV